MQQNGDALIDAALAGNDDAVRIALERDPAAARRSIYVAAAVADAKAVLALLDADPSIADRRGGTREWTPLLYLCCSRYRRSEPDMTAARVAIARRLIDLGADVNATGHEAGLTADSVTIFDEHKWQAVEGAAGRVASPELVRLLLEAGAELEKTTKVLTHAVRGGSVDVLRLLLEAARERFAVLAAASGDAELALENWYQVGAAILASVVLERTDMARMLSAYRERPVERALLEAIRLERDVELIDVLLADDKSELSRPVRQSLYRYAVRYGHRSAVELLRRRGADDDTVTHVDRVIGACVTGDRAELRRLVEESPQSKSALHEEDHRMLAWAIRSGHHQAIPLMLEAGLDPNVPDNDGETPLHLAVRAASLELVDTVLRAGAAVDARNFDAQTPFEIALALPNAEVRERLTRRLLDSGASLAPMRGWRISSRAAATSTRALRAGTRRRSTRRPAWGTRELSPSCSIEEPIPPCTMSGTPLQPTRRVTSITPTSRKSSSFGNDTSNFTFNSCSLTRARHSSVLPAERCRNRPLRPRPG